MLQSVTLLDRILLAGFRGSKNSYCTSGKNRVDRAVTSETKLLPEFSSSKKWPLVTNINKIPEYFPIGGESGKVWSTKYFEVLYSSSKLARRVE